MRFYPAGRSGRGRRDLRRARHPAGSPFVEPLERRSLLATLGVVASQLQFVSTTPGTSNNVSVGVGAGGAYIVGDSAETITLDATLRGLGWTLDPTGHVAQGLRGTAFNSASIDPVDGIDQVAILSIDVPVVIAPSVGDTLSVTLGNAGNAQGLNGGVTVANPNGSTTIAVDDSADATGRSGLLNAVGGANLEGMLTGLTPQPVVFQADDQVTFDITAGIGDDTLTADFGAGDPVPTNGLNFDGGKGNNTLNLRNGTFDTETHFAEGPGAGSISLGGRSLSFQDLRPVNDTVAATNFVFVPPVNSQTTELLDGPIINAFPTDVIVSGDTPAAFEQVRFANKTNVTINSAPSGTTQVFDLNAPDPAAGLTTLTHVTAASTLTPPTVANLFATPAGVTTVINGTNDNITVTAFGPGIGAGGGVSVLGGGGASQISVNAGGRAVDVSKQGQIAIAGTPGLSYTNVPQIAVGNAGNFPLTPAPQQVAATKGVPLTNTPVGGFSDADPTARLGLYSATIDWGDGSTATAGAVVARGAGSFGVVGSHTYLQAGNFPVTIAVADAPNTNVTTFPGVTITVNDAGGTLNVASTAVVSESTLTGRGLPVSGVEGFALAAPVAAFVDSNPFATPASYVAQIDWGDGTAPSAGTITQANGIFFVNGTHLYENHGTYPVTVVVSDAVPDRVTGLRRVLANFTTTSTIAIDLVVRNTNDSGRSSLRYVIDAFDALGLGGTIPFDIPGPGPYVIHLASPLDPLTVPAVIDASTQPGFAGSPIVEVDGSAAGPGDGIVLQSPSGRAGVRSLAVGGFSQGVGIAIEGAGGDVVQDSWIGTDLTGAAALPNYQGVLILGSSFNTLFDDVISGNLSAGVQILDTLNVSDPAVTFPTTPAHSTSNVIAGNRIGTNAAGTGPLGNQQGVFINDAAMNLLRGNVISANRSIGVQLLGALATGNAVIGNAIGTDGTRTIRLGNSVGVYLYAGPGNSVASNVFAFNMRGNVQVRPLAAGPEVQGVTFATDASGDLTGAVLTFTNYLDRARAQSPRNYSLSIPGPRFVPGTPIAIGQPVYNNVGRTVTIAFAQPVPAATEIRLQVFGRLPTGLTDSGGDPLDGASTLPARAGGSDFIAFYRRGVQINPT